VKGRKFLIFLGFLVVEEVQIFQCLDRDIFAQASIDLLAEASDAIPRTTDLLARSAWFIAARAHASSIEPDHVHQAIKLIPSAHDKIIHP
jgi:hypothetical protein